MTLTRTGRIDPAGDHHGHRDHPAFNPDLLIQGIDPEERILLGQGSVPKIGDLGVELLVELRDLSGGDVLDPHRPGQAFDLPGAHSVDEGLLDNCDQGLFGPPFFRDEKWNIAALPDLWYEKIDRPHPGIDPPGTHPGKVRRPLRRVLPLGRPNFGFGFDPHHFGHDPLEHGQERIRLIDELQ